MTLLYRLPHPRLPILNREIQPAVIEAAAALASSSSSAAARVLHERDDSRRRCQVDRRKLGDIVKLRHQRECELDVAHHAGVSPSFLQESN